MHSEPASTPASRWTWLRSQGLGVCCGLATVALLGIGSFVLARTRGGASAGVELDDIRAFFDPLSVTHLWFYLLIPVLGLYALNTLLATWHSVGFKWRNGFREPSSYAAAIIHVGFLVAMFAHLVGGIGGETGGLLVGADWTGLPDGRDVRVTAFDMERSPDGTPKTMRASLEVRGPGGEIQAAVIGFNEPLSTGLGSKLLLFQRPVSLPAAAVIAAGGERCLLQPSETCRLAGLKIELLGFRETGRRGGTAAHLSVNGQETWLIPGRPQPLTASLAVTLLEIQAAPGAVVTWRLAPGNPWALVSAVLLALGVGLMWRRWI